jgi:hypothetical protein
MSKNSLKGAEAGKALGDALAGNTVLKELDLSGKRGYPNMDIDFVKAFTPGLSDNRALSIIANVMGNIIGKEMLSKLQEIMRSKPNLVSLCGIADDATEADLSGLGMDDDDAIILASELPDKGALTSLDLSSNFLKAKGGKLVAEAIKVNDYVIAVILVPFSCPSDHWFNCCCLMLSTGYGGIIVTEYQQQ